MSSSSTPFDYVAVYAFFARFFAVRWRKEPKPSLDVEEVITAAYHRIDQQDMEIRRLVKRCVPSCKTFVFVAVASDIVLMLRFTLVQTR